MKFLRYISIFLITYAVYGQSSDFEKQLNSCLAKGNDLVFYERLNYSYKCYNGLEAPNFSATTIDGEQIELHQLRGSVVVINFWFLACPPCVAEIPGLNEIKEKYKDQKVTFIGITRDDEKTLNTYFKNKVKFNFKMIANNSSIYKDIFKLKIGFPTTVIIDQDGIIQYLTAGGRTDDQATEDIKNKLIPEIDKYVTK